MGKNACFCEKKSVCPDCVMTVEPYEDDDFLFSGELEDERENPSGVVGGACDCIECKELIFDCYDNDDDEICPCCGGELLIDGKDVNGKEIWSCESCDFEKI